MRVDETLKPTGFSRGLVHAKTGEEKKGRYFVLKIDAKDDIEARIVRAALLNYASMQRIVGRRVYCHEIVDYVMNQSI